MNDFELYWKTQLQFIKEYPLDKLAYHFTKTCFSVFPNIEYYDLEFTSFDGSKIYAKYLKPTKDIKGLILHFHGYPGCSRNWFEKTSLVALGYAVVAMDLRDQGGRSKNATVMHSSSIAGHVVGGIDGEIDDLMVRRQIIDMGLLFKIMKQLPESDHQNFISCGFSQGGAFSIYCASLFPEIKKAIILYPFLTDIKYVYDNNYDEVAYEGLRYYDRWYNTIGSQTKLLFEKLNYIDTLNFASKIKAKVLFGASKQDTICPYETQLAVFNKLKAEKKIITYTHYAHENIPDFHNEIANFLLED